VREALACIVNDINRTNDVVDRVGCLIKKAPPRKELIDLNAAILEVTALTRGEAVKSGVTMGTQLADDLSPIQCDRVQLQQVILNLIVNAIHSWRRRRQPGIAYQHHAYRAGWRVRLGAGHRRWAAPGEPAASL
jgi:nitrogen-specific signal transduction histidine kinase